MTISTRLLISLALVTPHATAATAAPPAELLLPGESRLFTFEDQPGRPGMSGWTPASTGGPFAQRWLVEPVEGAPSGPAALVLRDPAATGQAFNLCAFTDARVRDAAASVWLRAIAGTEDRGGGLAWRIQSLDHGAARDYYAARWNPLENNFRVYVIKDGVRATLASADLSADPDAWHAVSISHVGSTIEALFDGGARLVVEDSTFTTPGYVAVWTKADAATAFDAVSIADATPAPKTMLQTLQRDARRLRPLVSTPLARDFLAATTDLPSIKTRVVFLDRATRTAYTQEQADALPEDQRAALARITADESYYYTTRYGSPLAYARALDLAARHGLGTPRGTRILDFGYGTIGHLRLLASLGAHCTGVEIDPTLELIYNAPGDTGPVGTRGGAVALLTGSWPGDDKLRAAAAAPASLDLFLSKNTLKRGYIHPERPVDQRMLVKLGVPDEPFVAAVAQALRPGGLFLIYNICPAPAPPDQPYKPWADGRSPFPREMLEAAGFDVLAFDQTDHPAVRDLARALDWHTGDRPMDLENDLFAWFTLAKKR